MTDKLRQGIRFLSIGMKSMVSKYFFRYRLDQTLFRPGRCRAQAEAWREGLSVRERGELPHKGGEQP